MKILITGCAGFIGSHVYETLNNEGFNVYGLDNLSFGSKDATTLGFLVDGFENQTSQFLNSYDIIVHLATICIQHAQNNPIETFKTNTLDTIEMFSKYKGKIVYTSTASVYGNNSEFPTKETSKLDCIGAYAISKRITELFLQSRGNYTTLRLSNVYGKTVPNRQYTNVVESFNRSNIVEIQGDGRQTRDFTHVSDVVRAVKYAIEQPALNTEINICSGEETNLLVLAYLMDKQATFTGRRDGECINRRWLDNTRARDLLGWWPEISLQKGLKML